MFLSDFWTPEREARLAELCREGLRDSHIAEILGCTKNMVVGKRYRAGVPSPFPPGNLPKPPARPVPVCEPVPAGGVTITELSHWHCRWPNGDPSHASFRYCGARKRGGGPYCGPHHELAFPPAIQSRRRSA